MAKHLMSLWVEDINERTHYVFRCRSKVVGMLDTSDLNRAENWTDVDGDPTYITPENLVQALIAAMNIMDITAY